MKTIDTVVEIKHNMFELFLLCVVTYMCFLVSIKKPFCTLRFLFFIFKHFVRFLFEGGFYSRAASIQENTVSGKNSWLRKLLRANAF